MAKRKQQPLMPELTFRAAEELLRQRKKHIERLEIARRSSKDRGQGGVLGITLYGTYQDEEFVDRIRPYVVSAIIADIVTIDEALAGLGVQPDPIPPDPREAKECLDPQEFETNNHSLCS